MANERDAAALRAHARVTRAESVRLRAELRVTRYRGRRQIRLAKKLVATARESLGLDLAWQEPDGELDRVLVPLDGG
jgi:hypothetical protein